MRIALLAAALAAGTGCATSTTILSEPPGATVTYHGRTLGQTPLDYSSEDWIWENRKLEVSYPGYQQRTVLLRRDDVNPAMAIASGAVFFFLCWPVGVGMFLAGGMDYPEEYYVKLRPLRSYPAPLPPPTAPPPARYPPPSQQNALPPAYEQDGVPY